MFLNFIKDEYRKANEENVMKNIYLLRVSNTIKNERLMVIIDSTNPYDQNWFCEEANNRNRN